MKIDRPGAFNDPDYYDALATLRRESPVFECLPKTWLITKYDHIRAISRDTENFSSARGVLVNDSARRPGASAPIGSILHMDPPEHADYRRIVSRDFTPRATGPMEAQIQAIADRVFDGLPRGEEIDFVEHVASPVPVTVIAELLGVSGADLADFRKWSDAMIEVSDNPSPEIVSLVIEFARFLEQEIAARTAMPRDDMISVLTQSTLTPQEIQMFCITLLVAGNETTRHLLSGGAEALAAHPDQRAHLVANPAAMPGAVEELLRWVTPIQAMGRTATTDVEVGAETLKSGDFAVLMYASGNRDEDAYGPSASELDVMRTTSPANVTFGFGEHNCLGAPLARMEGRIVFEQLLRRFPDYELV
nr:cytochrome P450 [Actinomycetota bacterium]